MGRKRTWHYLSVPKRVTWPQKIICFTVHHDIEKTNNGNISASIREWQARCLNYNRHESRYDDGISANGKSKQTMWAALYDNAHGSQQTWAYGFNIAWQLGLLGLWQLLEDGELYVSERDPHATEVPAKRKRKPWHGCVILNDPPTILALRMRGRKGTIKMIDIANYGVGSMPGRDETGVDLTSVVKWVQDYMRLVHDAKLGTPQCTGASQAFHGYRHSYMQEPILIHGNMEALSLERESLYSGRCEAFRLGRIPGPIYHLDFNSMYPSIAASEHVPVRLRKAGVFTLGEVKRLFEQGHSCISEVFIETDTPNYPKRHNGNLVFPTGRFCTSLAGPELQLAIARRHVIKLGRTCYYECADVFSQWVMRLHELRSQAQACGNAGVVSTYKRLAVAIFGKFAQYDWRWMEQPDYAAQGAWSTWYGPRPLTNRQRLGEVTAPTNDCVMGSLDRLTWCRWRSLAWHVECESERSEAHESAPAITAHIYSAARIRLLAAMALCGYDNVYYVDTDSIWTNKTGFSCLQRAQLIDDNELGKLKLVGVHPWMRILGLKHYETPTMQCHAGVPSHASAQGNWQFTWCNAERLPGALAQQRAPTGMIIKRQVKFDGPYRHRNVHLGGKTTPLLIMED